MARVEEVSSGPLTRRSRMPVRWTIHSSVVSTRLRQLVVGDDARRARRSRCRGRRGGSKALRFGRLGMAGTFIGRIGGTPMPRVRLHIVPDRVDQSVLQGGLGVEEGVLDGLGAAPAVGRWCRGRSGRGGARRPPRRSPCSARRGAVTARDGPVEGASGAGSSGTPCADRVDDQLGDPLAGLEGDVAHEGVAHDHVAGLSGTYPCPRCFPRTRERRVRSPNACLAPALPLPGSSPMLRRWTLGVLCGPITVRA